MSFWNTSDNENAANTGTQFETGGGDIKPIPANTRVKAMIEDAKWDDFQGDQFISLRHTVLEPHKYKNRKVFQKVRVADPDAKKADKAKRMLAAIDANCGGQLAKSNEAPDDMALQSALLNKPMLLQLQVWEMEGSDGQKRSGNWVSAVGPASGQVSAPAKNEEEGEEIPF